MKNTLLATTAFLINLVIFFTSVSLHEPREEVRAVWLTTYANLDWPTSLNPIEQQRELLEIIEWLHAARFNTIFFQVRARGDAFYNSNYEPWARELTGVLGKNPGWDPLAYIIEEAQARGMEVHAWFNVYKVWGLSPVPVNSFIPHVLTASPEWSQRYNGEWWLDPGIPEVNEYLLKVALDLVKNYPVNGIHFDHIRYPGSDFNDVRTYNLFAHGEDRNHWRRENINRFVREFYRRATAICPGLKVGSSPLGVYNKLPGYFGSTTYSDYFQDAELWLREGVHDYIAPQIYWNIGDQPQFDIILNDWLQRAHGRHIYTGIGLFKQEVQLEWQRQMTLARSLDTAGHAYFRYSHVRDIILSGWSYENYALIPSMPWKSRDIPSPPKNFIVSSFGESSFWLEWSSPLAEDSNDETELSSDLIKTISLGERTVPRWYIIYRSPFFPIDKTNPENIVAILPPTETKYIDRIERPYYSRYYYSITSANAAFVESEPSAIRSGVIPEK